MKRNVYIITFIVFISLTLRSIAVFSQEENFFSSDALRDFIYNFQGLISGGNDGVLCLYGYDEVIVNLQERYKDTNIFIIEHNNLESSSLYCKLVYIGRDRGKYLKSTIGKFNDNKIVSISFANNFLEYGGTIHMQPIRRGIGLMLNHEKIKDFNIEFNPVVYNIIINKK